MKKYHEIFLSNDSLIHMRRIFDSIKIPIMEISPISRHAQMTLAEDFLAKDSRGISDVLRVTREIYV